MSNFKKTVFEDILALITGKVLFVEDGEYTTFVKLTD